MLPVAPIHVCVFQVPAPGDEAWRHTVAAYCEANGWAYYEQFDDTPLRMDPALDGLTVTWSRYVCPTEHPIWIVQSCDPGLAIETLEARYGFSRAEAELHASGRFADISDLVQNGGHVSDHRAALEVPKLGFIQPPEAVIPDRPSGSAGLLSIYDSPCVAGPVVMICPPERLSLVSKSVETTDQGRTLWLVGRRRVIVQGPDIWAPPGRWTAEVEFVLDAPVSVSLGFDWGQAGTVEQMFSQSGRYLVELSAEPAEKFLLDLRISLLVPVLNGHLTIRSLTIRRA